MKKIGESVVAVASVITFGAILAVGLRLGNYVVDSVKDLVQNSRSTFSKKEKES